jgi:hypothetical protein
MGIVDAMSGIIQPVQTGAFGYMVWRDRSTWRKDGNGSSSEWRILKW